MNKRSIIFGLLGLVAVTILASCSSTSQQDVTKPAPAPAPAPMPAPVASSTPVPMPPRQAEPVVDTNREQVLRRQPILSRRVDPTMVFQHYGVNPTIDTEEENTSTFSIDADTASYSISRAFLDSRRLPDPAAIRVEEFVNAFDYGYQQPAEELFAMQAEAFPSPYRRGFHVLHLGIKGADLDQIAAKPNNITFLIDVSGSMKQGQRLEIVKDALNRLLETLNRDDTIAIVAYTNTASLVLEPTSARYRRKIRKAVDGLQPLDSTNIQAGLELAYQVANKSYHPDFNNRIILCSDGVANTGQTNPKRMLERISDAAQRGIYLNAIGVGMGNYNDVILETLAKQGQGQYGYINSFAEAQQYFEHDLAATLQVLARDVRIQVEFDPNTVVSYRLLGYENRAMDNSDFTNARKDAGEVGVGHTVTAVYEIKLRNSQSEGLGHFRLAYKTPDSEQLMTVDKPLPRSIIAGDIHQASAPAQLSYIAAAFAEKLRCSYWSRTYSYNQLEDWSYQLRRQVPQLEQVEQLRAYIALAGQLDQRRDPYADRVSIRDMDFDRVPVLQ